MDKKIKNLIESKKLQLKKISSESSDKRIKSLEFLVKGLKRKLINFSDYLNILNDKKNMKDKLKSMKFDKNIEESKIIILNRMDEILNHDKFKRDNNKLLLSKFEKLKLDFKRLSTSEKEIILSSKNINNEKKGIQEKYDKKEEELKKINKEIEILKGKSKKMADSIDKKCMADDNEKCPDNFKKVVILFTIFVLILFGMIKYINN